MIEELDENHNMKSDIISEKQYEDIASFCNRFLTHVSNLVEIFKEHGNLFEDQEMTTANSRGIILQAECARSVMLSNVMINRHSKNLSNIAYY